MVVSFGIEFEYDSLRRSGTYFAAGESSVEFKNGFTYQPDGTAGTEVRTPVLTDVNRAAYQISQLFRSAPNNDAPVMKGIGPVNRSLGQHIHIGIPNRSLSSREKRRVALHAKRVYPFLVAIHANSKRSNVKSQRGRDSNYCHSIGNKAIDHSHHGEISDSHHGTVEFRKFDANIPQASLTCATILKVVAQGALNGEMARKPFREFDYTTEMDKAVNSGFDSLDVQAYLNHIFSRYAREWHQLLTEENVPECVWELLHLATLRKSVADIAEEHVYNDRDKEYEYFRSLSQNCELYFGVSSSIPFLDGLVGRYAPSIPDVRPRIVRPIAERTIVQRAPQQFVYNLEQLRAEVQMIVQSRERVSPLQHLRMAPHLRYVYAYDLYATNVRGSIVYNSLRGFIGHISAEYEAILARRLYDSRQSVEAQRRIIMGTNLWPKLKNQLIAIFCAGQITQATQTVQPVATVVAQAAQATRSAVVRFSTLTQEMQEAVASYVGMSIEQVISSPERFYVAIEDNAISAVGSAHVRCSCNPGEYRLIRGDSTSGIVDIMTEEIRSAGRRPVCAA